MTKRCGACGDAKPLDQYYWRRKAKNQRDNMCKSCRATYRQEHYVANRQRYIDNAAARTRRVTEERTRLIIDYLRRHPCVDCGIDDVVVLEFDHLRDKRFHISEGIRGNRSLGALLDEMAKCEVVCANCHRRRTAVRGGFMRALMVATTG